MSIKLKEDILIASKERDIDPYSEPFNPSDLGLKSSGYGSFSDYCLENDSVSSKHNKVIILKVAKRDAGGRPAKYLLLKDEV